MKESRNKIAKLIIVMLVVFCSVFAVTNCKTTTVQAASASTMKKAYRKYIKKNKHTIKGYSIVKIGPSKKPALLVFTGSDWKQGNIYYSCKVYYYIGGKVKFMGSYGGGRPLALYKRNGKYYLWNGNSSDKSYASIKSNRLNVNVYSDSKELYYHTEVNTRKTGRSTYKTYTMSKANYSNTIRKYKFYKNIKFQKVY